MASSRSTGGRPLGHRCRIPNQLRARLLCLLRPRDRSRPRSAPPNAVLVALLACAARGVAPAPARAAARVALSRGRVAPHGPRACRVSRRASPRAGAPQRTRRTGRAAASPPSRKLRGNPARALMAFQAMQRQYYIPGSGLYAGEPFSYLWPFSQALAATVSVANVPALAPSMARELQARLVGLQAYLDANNSALPKAPTRARCPPSTARSAPPVGPGGPKYYDDNDWVGIELVRLYKLTRNAAALAEAEQVMAFEMAGWDTNPELGCPGGIPFSNASKTPTATPSPRRPPPSWRPALSHDGQPAVPPVRRDGLRMGAPLPAAAERPLRRPHRQPRRREPTLWSYNQGTMIGAGALLYQATGNASYLYAGAPDRRAPRWPTSRPNGSAPRSRSSRAVYFRNLLYLDSITHDPPGSSRRPTWTKRGRTCA